MSDDLDEARRRHQKKRDTKPAGTFGPSVSKQTAITQVMLKVDAAAKQRRDYYDGKRPTPERITEALDLRMLYGPEVDQVLGGEEPMVDEWESGERVPTFEQVQALAELTGFPVAFFYQPPPPPLGDVWVCGTDGCEILPG